jgi:hypothetical protein
VPWLRRLVAGLSPRRPGFAPVGFVVEKAALGKAFLRILRVSPVSIIPQWAPHFRKLKIVFSLIPFIHSLIHSHPGTNSRPVKAAAVQWDVSLTPIIRIPKYHSRMRGTELTVKINVKLWRPRAVVRVIFTRVSDFAQLARAAAQQQGCPWLVYQFLRNRLEQRPSNQGDLDSCVTGEFGRVYHTGWNCFWFHFYTVVRLCDCCWIAF